METYDT